MSTSEGAASASSSSRFALLIIDPQVDFHGGGALAVGGADEDAARIRAFILAHLDRISAIYVTLDSHQRMHISHGLFWKDAEGNPPQPFTPISHADVAAGKWMPVNGELKEYAVEYTRKLEAGDGGRFQHIIWPEHCLIGSPGHCVVPPVLDAIHAWSAHARKPIDYYWKGTNILAEMYSVFRAEVPVPGDPATDMNLAFVDKLKTEPRILICGQALSHCVNFSTRDLISAWPKDRLGDLTLLRHMSSPVGGFEAQAQAFVDFLREQGVQVVDEGV